jgi:hypothetical protein
MIVTVRADVTWEGKNKQFANQSDKFFEKLFKTFCEAQHVDVISVDSWYEDNEES